MLLPAVFLYYSDKKQVVQISYSDYDMSETGKIQDKVVDVVKEVTNDNMSELEKVTALNQYLVDHAEYDYDSLEEVEKMEQLQTKGSDDEASKIGGQLNVKIDGQWRVVDVTWNDTGGPDHTQDYLNLALNDPLYTNSHYPDAQFKESYPVQ